MILGGICEHDFLEEVFFAVAAAAAVLGVLVIVEGVVGGLAEVAAAENEVAEAEVQGLEEALPVIGALEFDP